MKPKTLTLAQVNEIELSNERLVDEGLADADEVVIAGNLRDLVNTCRVLLLERNACFDAIKQAGVIDNMPPTLGDCMRLAIGCLKRAQGLQQSAIDVVATTAPTADKDVLMRREVLRERGGRMVAQREVARLWALIDDLELAFVDRTAEMRRVVGISQALNKTYRKDLSWYAAAIQAMRSWVGAQMVCACTPDARPNEPMTLCTPCMVRAAIKSAVQQEGS